MISLGSLPGGSTSGEANAASADGSTVVGRTGLSPFRAFVWDEPTGMRDLRALLMDDFGLDLIDWELEEAFDISHDGLTIVGDGVNPNGDGEAWIVTVPWLGPCIHGDMNRDEQVDAADIAPFIDALLSMPDVTPADRCAADVNADYEIDGHDIQALADKMLL
jgi:hypothetical protein